MEHQRPQPETVFFARPSADIVVIRVEGRGSNLNSPALQQVAERCFSENPHVRFIIDLERCSTMDSTFMGALAGITRRQSQAGMGRTTVVNVRGQVLRLLGILGLNHALDLREAASEPASPPIRDYEVGEAPKMSKLERTVHLIQAHEELVNLDNENEVKFEGVLQYLKESLERQRKQKPGGC